MTDQPQTIVKSAFSFLSGTVLSRVSGLARDLSMAFFFGTSASIAAFLMALRFATIFRRIFGEGALLNGFIPYFEAERKIDPKRAALFFRDLFFSITLLLIVFIGVGEWILYQWIEFSPIIYLVMLIVPGVLFACLFGICSGLLHCEKIFFLTGVAPVAYNAIWLIAVWMFRKEQTEVAAVGLSIAITCAFFFQWLMTVPKAVSFIARYLSWKECFMPRLFSLEIRKMFASLSLGVLGVTAVQINTAIDTVFARIASLEGPAYLNYAIHLQQLPLALFGIAISSALLPPLSRAFQANDTRLSQHLLESAIANTFFFIFPCTAAIFSLGRTSVNLLFGRGSFTAISILNTTECLWGYGIGLLPTVLTLIFAPVFYAKKDFRTPTFISLCSIILNFFLNFLFVSVFHLGPASLAYSTSFSALINAILLYRALPFKISIDHTSWKVVIGSLVAAMSTIFFDRFFFQERFPDRFGAQLLQFSTLFTIFAGFFILVLRKEVFAMIGKKI